MKWQAPETLHGIAGNFKTAAGMTISLKTRSEPANSIVSEGDFSLKRKGATAAEKGKFRAMGENPAIGFASLNLLGPNGKAELYVVNSIKRDAAGKIQALKMAPLSQTSNRPGKEFTMLRTP